jgi:hypothetical protein
MFDIIVYVHVEMECGLARDWTTVLRLVSS